MQGVAVLKKNTLMQAATEAAAAGLDFIVRNQCCCDLDANCGRVPYEYDVENRERVGWSPNWIAAISVQALLGGYRYFGEKKYLESAGYAIEYLRSLQEFSPLYPDLHGVIREKTPQTDWFHPRDALTAAWAMLDWSLQTGDVEARECSELYAQWFMKVAMKRGYPYWTVRFDGDTSAPDWFGSFHSGGAYYFYRLFMLTGRECYRETMMRILDFYNENHIDSSGHVTVIRDCKTMVALDNNVDPTHSNPVWQKMHVYNDDFGALANLAAFSLTEDKGCLDSARRFLKRMAVSQQNDGGFGDQDGSVPSAAGTVLLEAFAAKDLGFQWIDDKAVQRAVNYLLELQYRGSDTAAGIFCETSQHREANLRTHAYAIMALLRYVGAKESCFPVG